MLRLRQEQLDAFSAGTRRRFEKRLVAHLRTRDYLPERLREDAALGQLVRDVIEASARFGITREWDVTRFAEIALRHSGADWGVSAPAWVRPILEDASLSGGAKVDLLFEHLELWYGR